MAHLLIGMPILVLFKIRLTEESLRAAFLSANMLPLARISMHSLEMSLQQIKIFDISEKK